MVKTSREFELRARAAWNTGWVDDHNSAVASGALRVAGSLYSGITPAPKVPHRNPHELRRSGWQANHGIFLTAA
jgi:hypothetical protein